MLEAKSLDSSSETVGCLQIRWTIHMFEDDFLYAYLTTYSNQSSLKMRNVSGENAPGPGGLFGSVVRCCLISSTAQFGVGKNPCQFLPSFKTEVQI